MAIDFNEQYRDYSNSDLLKIIQRPVNYQPSAVEAANQILSERQVSQEEVLQAEQFYQEMEQVEQSKKQQMDGLKNQAVGFLAPVFHPTEKLEPQKWLNILLLVIGLQYAWSLYETIYELVRFVHCSYCHFTVGFFAELLTLLYVPLIFFLLFKRRRWDGSCCLQTIFLL